MAKKLDKVIIVDVESTCWDGKPPEGQQSEIIEIGICMLDMQSGEIEDSRGIMVKPVHSEISDFCTKLTTITSGMIENEGIDFKEACKILVKEYDVKNRVWISWGDYDRRQFERNCQLRKISYPFGTAHINAKSLFALQKRLEHEVGMERALEMLEMPLDGTHHRGKDDARNIAKIVRKMI